MLTSLGSSGTQSSYQSNYGVRDYKFSFQQSYAYPNRLSTQILNQQYFVDQHTLYHFQHNINKKYRTDDSVEQEVMRRLNSKCSEAKKERQSYLKQAKRYEANESAKDMYLQKAEDVSMEYCTRFRENENLLKAKGK